MVYCIERTTGAAVSTVDGDGREHLFPLLDGRRVVEYGCSAVDILRYCLFLVWIMGTLMGMGVLCPTYPWLLVHKYILRIIFNMNMHYSNVGGKIVRVK